MEEGGGPGQDPDMLGDGAGLHAEEDQRAGACLGGRHLDHHAPRALGQHLAQAGLAPVPAVGRDRERLGADDLAPDAPRQPEAIAADTAQAGLIMIRRSEPGPRNGDDVLGISGVHSTDPSCPPSFVA